jgi:hypothetical protein
MFEKDMDSRIPNLIEEMMRADTLDEIRHLQDEIAVFGEAAVPDLLAASKAIPRSLAKSSWIVEVLVKIGYPANQLAILSLVDHACNSNSPGYEIAFDAVLSIGEPTIPAVRDCLQFYSRSRYDDGNAIMELCYLINHSDPCLAEQLVPDLIGLLEKKHKWYAEYVIETLCKVGSPKADLAIPLLREKILDNSRSHRRRSVRKAAIEALPCFDPAVVKPLIPILRDCLRDKSEIIQESARKTLTQIGEFGGI